VNPRNEQPIPGIDDAQARRILRRGIPYGRQLSAAGEKSPHDRGLLFLSAQGNIGEQFQFMQRAWANDPLPTECATTGRWLPTHPWITGRRARPDVGQHHGTGVDNLKREGKDDTPINLMKQFVTVTGGEYFFCPSISTIEAWGS
jgi:deferrochelatase/peroxidase EfeB